MWMSRAAVLGCSREKALTVLSGARWQAWSRMGTAHFALKHFTEACDAYARAVQLEYPLRPTARAFRARTISPALLRRVPSGIGWGFGAGGRGWGPVCFAPYSVPSTPLAPSARSESLQSTIGSGGVWSMRSALQSAAALSCITAVHVCDSQAQQQHLHRLSRTSSS